MRVHPLSGPSGFHLETVLVVGCVLATSTQVSAQDDPPALVYEVAEGCPTRSIFAAEAAIAATRQVFAPGDAESDGGIAVVHVQRDDSSSPPTFVGTFEYRGEIVGSRGPSCRAVSEELARRVARVLAPDTEAPDTEAPDTEAPDTETTPVAPAAPAAEPETITIRLESMSRHTRRLQLHNLTASLMAPQTTISPRGRAMVTDVRADIFGLLGETGTEIELAPGNYHFGVSTLESTAIRHRQITSLQEPSTIWIDYTSRRSRRAWGWTLMSLGIVGAIAIPVLGITTDPQAEREDVRWGYGGVGIGMILFIAGGPILAGVSRDSITIDVEPGLDAYRHR